MQLSLTRARRVWLALLPVGDRFSLDRWFAHARDPAGKRRQEEKEGLSPVLCLPAVGLYVSWALMYVMAGLTKNGDTWRKSGVAVELVLKNKWWSGPGNVCAGSLILAIFLSFSQSPSLITRFSSRSLSPLPCGASPQSCVQ